jgi:hypothetical protein
MSRFTIRNIMKVLRASSGVLFGRVSSGVGPGEELSPSQVRTLLSVPTFAEVAASFQPIGSYAAASHTHGNISNAGAIGTTSGVPIITGASGVLQAGSFGTTAGTFCQGNDSRLSGNIGGSTGATANRVLTANGTGGSTLQASPVTIDGSGNVTGAAAITASGDIRVGASSVEYINLSSNTNSTIQAYSNALGAHYLLIGDSTGSGGPMEFRIGAGGLLSWQSTNRADAGTTDLAFGRDSAGVLGAWTTTAKTTRAAFTAADITASGLMCAGSYTVATLPSASANAGKFAVVTDSSVTTNGTNVASGGSGRVMVFSNGTNWKVIVA